MQYLVSIVGELGTINRKQVESVFKLTLRNPCVNPDYVQIDPVPTFHQNYKLYGDKVEWTHEDTIYHTNPIGHSLCGDLSFTAVFRDEQDLSVDTAPVAYNTATR